MRPADEQMRDFAEAISGDLMVPRLGTVVLETDATDDWMQGKSMYGGLQAALGVRAMRAVVGSALPLRALQVTFADAVTTGPTRTVAERLRQGRSMTHVQCRLESEGKVAAVMVGLFGSARSSVAVMPLAPPENPPPRESLRDEPFIPGVVPAFRAHYRACWAEGPKLFSASPPRRTRMWVQLRDLVQPSPELNEASLVAITDLPPSPVMAMLPSRAPGMSLTWLVELLVDPRDVDPSAWILIQTESRSAGAGYTSQTALAWDESGRGLAIGHQTTAIFG